ncbi:putative pheophorbidase [Cocos nucifera]|uniref:Putative pheophorbidase n=1 Tax=Cocos nucifera TaxID=13894 RepID=A0A8K0I3B8_COCNU|nr:putative pheophorbidase [Cocos nucifera]
MAAIHLTLPTQCLPPLSFRPPRKKTTIPLSVFAAAYRARAPYPLKEGQSRLFHRLPSGLNMEFIFQKGLSSAAAAAEEEEEEEVEKGSLPPPLVFIHGSFHAAWCWAEHWLPYFSRAGFDCYALSLLGQGESDVPTGAAAGTLQTHTSDIADFIRKEVSLPPILIGHSFGGLIVQSYISKMMDWYSSSQTSSDERNAFHPLLVGAVLVCSVPPSGNSGLVWRYLMTKPIAAIKVTLSLAAKAFANSVPLCRETFFSSTMEDQLVLRYRELMKESSKLPLFDLKKLNASLPVPSVSKDSIQLLIMGSSDDFIVDVEGLYETAKFYDVQPVCVEGVAHDMMLDSSWEKGAEIILSWLKNLHYEQIV